MKKPDSLRAALIIALPDIAESPSKLAMYVDNGKVVHRPTMNPAGEASLSFEYRYQLNVMLLDFAGDPESVFLPILVWMREHQADTLQNLQKAIDAIRFEVDILNAREVDLSIELELTEQAIVTKGDDGRLLIAPAPEPVNETSLGALFSDSLLSEICPNP